MVRGKNKAGQRKAIKVKSKRVSYSPAGVSKLPRGPGVYTINDNGKKYVGSTGNLRRRNQEHLRNGKSGTSVSYTRTVTRQQAYAIERNKISRSCPSRNKTKPDSCKGFWEKNFGFQL